MIDIDFLKIKWRMANWIFYCANWTCVNVSVQVETYEEGLRISSSKQSKNSIRYFNKYLMPVSVQHILWWVLQINFMKMRNWRLEKAHRDTISLPIVECFFGILEHTEHVKIMNSQTFSLICKYQLFTYLIYVTNVAHVGRDRRNILDAKTRLVDYSLQKKV